MADTAGATAYGDDFDDCSVLGEGIFSEENPGCTLSKFSIN